MTWVLRIVLIAIGLLLAAVGTPLVAVTGVVIFSLAVAGESLWQAVIRTPIEAPILPGSADPPPASSTASTRTRTGVRSYWASWRTARTILRRTTYMWFAGFAVFAMCGAFIALRIVWIEHHSLGLSDLAATSGLAPLLVALMSTAILFAVPLGVLLHQLYYGMAVTTMLPIRFSPVDRAYEPLLEVSRLGVNFTERYGIKAPYDTTVIRGQSRRPPLLFLLGPDVYFIPRDSRHQTAEAVKNWELFVKLYRDLVPDDMEMAVDELAEFKDNNYVLLGVLRYSAALGWLAYSGYEASRCASSGLALGTWVEVTALSFLSTVVFVSLLNYLRAPVGRNALGFRLDVIKSALQTANPALLPSAVDARVDNRPATKRPRRGSQ